MNKKEKQRYEQIDLPFYKSEIAPILPDEVLDFHAHVWVRASWKIVPWQEDARGAKYMTTTVNYRIQDLLDDGRIIFMIGK